MAKSKQNSSSDLFIVDNSDSDWKVRDYLSEWADIAKSFDIATGYFEIGALLSLDGKWQKLEKLRILMGDEVSKRTKKALLAGIESVKRILDQSIEREKQSNDFLTGVPAIVEALRHGQIRCRVYTKDKFHAKAYITHAKHAVVGPSALVGSSNLTYPGLTQNVELNVQLRREVELLQEWYEQHWDEAQDITEEILKVIERHTREFSPFEVYAHSLREYFKGHEVTSDEWEQSNSKMYPVLARYQKDGYHSLLKIANSWDGSLLCDGVGLGKTYIGMMLIERLVKHDGKRVALFVPKAAREAVWESKIRKYIPELLEGFYSFRIYNHTDLSRRKMTFRLEQIREQADVIVIDEGHHFRNRGLKGETNPEKRSRYWRMFDVCTGKKVFLLTATPVNNRLADLQHMIELFSPRKDDGEPDPTHFKDAPLGIHSLPGHIRKMENALKKLLASKGDEDFESTDLAEAQQILNADDLFKNLVVQRSRSYVKKSVAQEENGNGEVLFPNPTDPKVVEYSVKQTYGKLLKMVEDAFHKDKPLFSLAMYYPWEYYTGDQENLKEQMMAMVTGRQRQVVRLIRTAFLKRFESSVEAFTASCRTLMKKLIAFYQVHAESKREKERLEKWLIRNKDITGHDPHRQHVLFEDDLEGEMIDEDIIEPEFFETAREGKLNSKEFNIPEILADTLNDLDTIAEFLKELLKFQPKQDKKLRALVKLLNGDSVLSQHKCMIFSEFKDTAKYLYEQLKEEGFNDIEEIDSETSGDNREILIKRFSPYYNDSSSPQLANQGLSEIRIMISTDVLSEGLNLQDATRLINYDLHWNPVRLMQRIGRIDRRLDPDVEQVMVSDHLDQAKIRGTIQYYNFLPPDELNVLLSLYSKVTKKTLRISKTFGIEGGKLLRAEDDYEMLKNFNAQYDGEESPLEKMHLEYQKLLSENPGLEERLSNLPGKVFSGKEHPKKDTKAVFFCYALPAPKAATDDQEESPDETGWTEETGYTAWYLYDLQTESIATEPSDIVEVIRSDPQTPRVCNTEKETLSDIRKKIEKHIKNTYLKKVQAPAGIKSKLKAWMEMT
jgi:superfamily II DNA/RNA helicase